MALTEGVAADIATGGAHRMLGAYVSSPLHWGVHVVRPSRPPSVPTRHDRDSHHARRMMLISDHKCSVLNFRVERAQEQNVGVSREERPGSAGGE